MKTDSNFHLKKKKKKKNGKKWSTFFIVESLKNGKRCKQPVKSFVTNKWTFLK